MTDQDELYRRFRQPPRELKRPMVRPARPLERPHQTAPQPAPSSPVAPKLVEPEEDDLRAIAQPLKAMAPAPLPARKEAAIRKWYRRRRIRLLVTSVVVLLVLAPGGYLWYLNQASATTAGIPKAILNEVHYAVVAPKTGTVSTGTVQYDRQQNSLSYHLSTAQTAVTVSQQALPEQFGDITGYATQFYSGLHQYATVQTGLGAVHLVHPNGNATPDVAVLTTPTSLVFVSSPGALTPDQWTDLMNGLQALP